MPSNNTLSDEYVASVLAKDAKDRSIKYSSYGLGALLPKRPTANAPKPNTRFLKNIIRETDNHNAALKAKEAQEARERLRKLRETSRKEREYVASDVEGRHPKRRRIEKEKEDGVIRKGRGHKHLLSERSRDHDDDDRRKHQRLPSSDDDDDAERSRGHRLHRHRHRSRSRERAGERDRRKDRNSKSHHRTRSRSRSPKKDRDSKHHRYRRRRSISSSPSSDEASRRKRPCKKHAAPGTTDNRHSSRHLSAAPNSASDSDPLTSLIGPPPPPSPPKVRSRGRGTFAPTSGIDNRFSNTYDPSADIHPNSDSENDWDQALEALRDRQKWKQQGADRLREAGFSEQEVKKWEKGGEKAEEDVVWKGRGEGREWDRGKVVGSDGEEVSTRAEWGRLM